MSNSIPASWIDRVSHGRALVGAWVLVLAAAAPAAAGTGSASVAGRDTIDADLFSVAAAAAAAPTHYFSVYDGGTQGGNYNNDGATGADSLAAGVGASSPGDNGIAIGAGAVAQNTRGVYLGTDAGVGATPGSGNADNLGIGTSAAQNVNGYDNNAIGVRAGSNLAGSYNTGIGTDAGGTLAGVANTALGANTGNNLSGSNNLAAGVASGNFLSGSNNVAMGAFAGSGSSIAPLAVNNTVAIGNTATATADDAIAIGLNAAASGNSSIAIGKGNVVSGASSGAFGDPSAVTGNASYAMGNNNIINANNAFVLGNGVTIASGLDGAVALGNGTTVNAAVPTAGVNISGSAYTFAGGSPAAGDVLSVGSAAAPRQIQNVAAGQISATSTDAVNGSELYVTNQAVTRLADGGAGPVQYSNTATPMTPNGGVPTQNLTLVGASAGAVSLHNVAAGVAPTDAVNVQQLNSATNSMLSNAEAYTDSRINGFQSQIGAVQRNGEAGTASAMAMAGVPQSYLPGKTMLAAGIADYGSQSSVAMGLSTLSDNGRWIVKLNGSTNTRGRYGAAVGAGVMW